MSAPEPRPDVLFGKTRKFRMECGHLYVTVNVKDGKPFEVFTRIGKAGGCLASYTEAIARLASLALRSGVEPEHVIKQLRGIGCASVCWKMGRPSSRARTQLENRWSCVSMNSSCKQRLSVLSVRRCWACEQAYRRLTAVES